MRLRPTPRDGTRGLKRSLGLATRHTTVKGGSSIMLERGDRLSRWGGAFASFLSLLAPMYTPLLAAMLLLSPGTSNGNSPTTTSTASDAVAALVSRGVSTHFAERLAAEYGAEAVVAWCAYAARQSGMGPGALIDGIRSAKAPPTAARQRNLDEQAAYAREIVTWITRHFPHLVRENEGPHPAAITAVIRLHHKHGRGRLTVREHAAEFRELVAQLKRDIYEEED